MSTPKSPGFTLLEMLTVLLIMSLIALLAYPSYMQYVYKTHRLDAMQSLFHYQGLWQSCRLHQVDALICLQDIQLAPTQTLPSLQGHYDLTAELKASGITFYATAVNQAADTTCFKFLLDNTGTYKSYTFDHQESTQRCI